VAPEAGPTYLEICSNIKKNASNAQSMFHFQNARINVSHVLHASVNGNISAIYPSVYTVRLYFTELYLMNLICAPVIGSSSPSPRGHSPYVL